MKRTFFAALAILMFAGGCDFDITNPNNPGAIGEDPSPQEVSSAVIGIILAARTDAGDWILDAGIIGREAYRFDGSDPRFIGEWIEGSCCPLLRGCPRPSRVPRAGLRRRSRRSST
jgi:hypothetical protein